MKRNLTSYDIQFATSTSIEIIEKVALTILAVILNLRAGETLEFEFFKIHKMDNSGVFFIDYDPEKLREEFISHLQSGDISPEVKENIEYILERWGVRHEE